MKARVAVLAGLAAVVASLSLVVATATAAPPNATQTLQVPISSTQSGGVLNGVFTITSFTVNSANQLVANGTFTGTALVNGVKQTVSTPAFSALDPPASCPILSLTLGPLHLNLLGLVVDLNQVNLNISAQPGPGNLLGNLLCAVTHLLDNTGGANTALQNLLNILNGLLGGL
jgi:hypothetical protein